MTFSRAKPGGYTDDVDVLPAGELNTIDVNQSRAIDGTDGGLYTPTLIRIAGDGIQLEGTLRLKYASRVISRLQPMTGAQLFTNFSYLGGIDETWIIQQDIAASTLEIALPTLPDGAVLDSVLARTIGAAGHGATPTATLPILVVHRRGASDLFPATLGSASDPSTTNTAYEAVHDHAVTGIAHTIDMAANTYSVRFDGEFGGDFQVGWQVRSILAICTVTEQPEY
jgi:hypothetical protein